MTFGLKCTSYNREVFRSPQYATIYPSVYSCISPCFSLNLLGKLTQLKAIYFLDVLISYSSLLQAQSHRIREKNQASVYCFVTKGCYEEYKGKREMVFDLLI